jgi:nucleotide-binding universal stress UspA family protein
MTHVLGSLQTLVVAVDLSKASEAVFEAALEVAHNSPNVKLHLVHISAGKKQTNEDAVVALTRWAERLPDHAVGVELHALESADPATAIVEAAARLKADLILIGTHGRSGLSRILIGSVAEMVVRTAQCSVLVVRAKTS